MNDDDYRNAAIEFNRGDDQVQVDHDAKVSRVEDGGAWVQVWTYYSEADAKLWKGQKS